MQTWQDIKINSKKAQTQAEFPTFLEYHGVSSDCDGISDKIVFDEMHFSDDAKVRMFIDQQVKRIYDNDIFADV